MQDINVILVVIAVVIELAVLGVLMFGVLYDNSKKHNTDLFVTRVEVELDSKQPEEELVAKLRENILKEIENTNSIQISKAEAKSKNIKTITASIRIIND